MSWKFYRDINVHIDITEYDKPHPAALGRRLSLTGGTRTLEFEDLDQIIAHYIQPISTYVDQLVQHRKFLDGKEERIEEELLRDKTANPDLIPYYISLNYLKPGRFRLSCKPSMSHPCKHEDILVAPEGYNFRGNTFVDPDRLITYFKSSSGPSALRQQPRPVPSSAPSSSLYSYPAQPYPQHSYPASSYAPQHMAPHPYPSYSYR